MLPAIDKRSTGINLRRIMDKNSVTVKDIQKHLGLSSIQSIYHWLNGICLPTLDNLYALSELFNMPLDNLICGNRSPRIKTSFTASLHASFHKPTSNHVMQFQTTSPHNSFWFWMKMPDFSSRTFFYRKSITNKTIYN